MREKKGTSAAPQHGNHAALGCWMPLSKSIAQRNFQLTQTHWLRLTGRTDLGVGIKDQKCLFYSCFKCT